MDLLQKDLGEGELSIKLEGGNIVLSASHSAKGSKVSLSVAVLPDYFLDKLAEIIPGQIDDSIILMLKAALKSK